MLELPEAKDILEGPLEVMGQLFLEVFCGCAVMTLGMMLVQVPCICPWDTCYGERFDVTTQGEILLQLAKARRISAAHLGTPCQSLTWARLPALRSWEHVEGLPTLCQHELVLVSTGNSLVHFQVP